LDALGLNLGYLLVQVLNFAIVFVVLRAWVYKPILNVLDKRSQKISQSIEDARKAEEARQNAEADAAKILEEARTKANDIVRQATEKAELAADDIKNEAKQKAKESHQEAVEAAEEERNRILADMRGQVAALAIAAAQKLIGEALDEKRQQALVDEFFSSVKQGKVTVLEGEKFDGKTAVVTTALPLTEAEKKVLEKDILKRSTGEPAVSFEVDPNLLGGLTIRIDDKVYDHSVSSQLSNIYGLLS
jgi:F-type H+-transporting ATPase subunit b